MPQQEENHKNRLTQARDAYKAVKNPVVAGISEAKRVVGLMRNLNPMLDWMFGIAFSLAALKDILDFVGFGSFPAVGTAVTLCVSFAIGLIMFIVGSGGKSKSMRGMIKRFGVLAGATLVEFFFGINFFPVESASVIAIFYMTLRSRAMASEQEEKKKKASQQIQQQAPAYADGYNEASMRKAA